MCVATPEREAEEEMEEELEDLPETEKEVCWHVHSFAAYRLSFWEVDPLRHAKIRREVNGKAFTGFVEDIEQGKITRERCLFCSCNTASTLPDAFSQDIPYSSEDCTE